MLRRQRALLPHDGGDHDAAALSPHTGLHVWRPQAGERHHGLVDEWERYLKVVDFGCSVSDTEVIALDHFGMGSTSVTSMEDAKLGRDMAGPAADNAEPGLETIIHMMTVTHCIYS